MTRNDLFEAARILYRNGTEFVDYGNDTRFKCNDCGTELTIDYLQNAIYIVSCGGCDIVKLVKAESGQEALEDCGYYGGEK